MGSVKTSLVASLRCVAMMLSFAAIFNLCQCQDMNEITTSTSTEPSTTTELRCHIALGRWIPKLMEDANMCVSDDPQGYDRMRLRNSSEPLPPLNCIFKCTGIRLGLFKEDGSADEQAIIAFIEENVIPQYKELAYDIIANCAEFSAALAGSGSDPNCMAHGRIFKCFADQAPKVVETCAMRLGIHRNSPPQPIMS